MWGWTMAFEVLDESVMKLNVLNVMWYFKIGTYLKVDKVGFDTCVVDLVQKQTNCD